MSHSVPDELLTDRLGRVRQAMVEADVPALLTADPIHIAYATGARNMTVFGLMGAVRFLLVVADGPIVLWEFNGCRHLAEGLATIDEIRIAPGVTANAGPGYETSARSFAGEVMSECRRWVDGPVRLGVERMDHPITDALRASGFTLTSATDVLLAARRIKLPAEVAVMREAAVRVEAGVGAMEGLIEPGRTEIDVWSELHRRLVASEGEYISTRLVQGGRRTFPYFQEAGPHRLEVGDLLCLDTDAIGFGGYAVDFSRTFVCGGGPLTSVQRSLYGMAHEQLCHNASRLAPGRSFEDFARGAWSVPARLAQYGYYCLAHGLGVAGEHPNVPLAEPGLPYGFPGVFEPGMVICVESYVGDPDHGEGVKLEDEYLVTDTGTERLTTYPFLDAVGP